MMEKHCDYTLLSEKSARENEDSLADRSEDALLCREDFDHSHVERRSRRSFIIAGALHLSLLSVYLLWTVLLLRASRSTANCEPGPDLIYCQSPCSLDVMLANPV